MSLSRVTLVCMALFCIHGSAVWAQIMATAESVVMSGGSSVSQSGSFKGTFSFSLGGPIGAITGAPYCGEQVMERHQTLADGTNIVQPGPTSQLTCRDSQGRTRTERTRMQNPRAGIDISFVEIADPVSGFRYVLDPYNKVAHQMKSPPPPTRPTLRLGASGIQAVPRVTAPVPPNAPPAPAPADRPLPAGAATGPSNMPGLVRMPGVIRPAPAPDPTRPTMTSEDLGTQDMQGVTVQGRRTTTTYPVGFQGNDRPIVVVSESWTSTQLRLMILSKTIDPRSGENTTKIINLSTYEPDAGLFQVPAGYTIVEETGPFTIEISRP